MKSLRRHEQAAAVAKMLVISSLNSMAKGAAIWMLHDL